MSEENVYICETSIQIGQHGFINQPKEIIDYIKYLQNQLQQKENKEKEIRKYIKNMKIWDFEQEYDMKKLLEILDKEVN